MNVNAIKMPFESVAPAPRTAPGARRGTRNGRFLEDLPRMEPLHTPPEAPPEANPAPEAKPKLDLSRLDPPAHLEEVSVEEITIDGICGVY